MTIWMDLNTGIYLRPSKLELLLLNVSHTPALSKATFFQVLPPHCWESRAESCQLCAMKLPTATDLRHHSMFVGAFLGSTPLLESPAHFPDCFSPF